jgi:uncharacterized protein with PQ loop repeat
MVISGSAIAGGFVNLVAIFVSLAEVFRIVETGSQKRVSFPSVFVRESAALIFLTFGKRRVVIFS